MNRGPVAGIFLALGVLCAPALFSAAGASPSCSDEKSHQFDFWIGEWQVTEHGKPAGTNRIEPILDGCVIQENWKGAQGGAGTSLNFYDTRGKQWRQFWVWRNGTTLELAGGLQEGRMVLEGDSQDAKGAKVHNRITWTPNPDGTVRQQWETSSDGGGAWQTAFDGLYRKK